MSYKNTLLASCVFAIAATGGASAQERSGGFLEEIVVNATKREQTIQDVPIAVSAYSGEQLRQAGITDVRELVQISPSLFLTSSASEVAGAVARIRGIGTTGDNPGLESSVAIFIDGVYRNRSNVGLTDLGPLERIEVLRGPQGTLFGRNASAGLINVVTANPKFETQGYGELAYGNYDFFRAAAGVTGAIYEDKIAARLDAVYTSRDGFYQDAVTGEDYNDRDRYLIRGKVLAEFDGGGSLLLSADYANRDEECCAAVPIVRGPTADLIQALGGRLGSGGTPVGSDPFDRVTATTPGRSYQQDVEEWGISAELNWDFDTFSFVSITAYRDWTANRAVDIDYTSLDILYRDENGQNQEFQTFTQEFRVNGQWGKLDWMVGAFYGNEDLNYDDAVRTGEDYSVFASGLVCAALGQSFGVDCGVPVMGATFTGYDSLVPAITGGAITDPLANGEGVVRDDFAQNSENWSLFTHNIFNVSELIDVTIGVRYTEEVKNIDISLLTNNPTCTAILGAVAAEVIPSTLATLPCLSFFNPSVDGSYSDRRKETEFTGTAAVNFKWTDDFSTYIAYSRGYKAGGFNLDRAGLVQDPGLVDVNAQLQFEQETVDSFEIGAKYRNPDAGFNINATIWYASFNDFQLNTFNGLAFVVNNVDEVENYGFELEGAYQPTEDLTFTGGVTYAIAEYTDDLPMGPGDLFEQPSAANPAPFSSAFFQLPGSQITNAPKWSLSTSVNYQPELTNDLKLIAYVDGRFTIEVNTGSDLDPEKIQDAVFIVNARLGLGATDNGWRVELFARNLFDTDYIQVAFDQPLQGSSTIGNPVAPATQTFGAFLAEPRTFGIQVRGDF
ncbi:MAG: TonB-dependent receptor [Pseudomonadota bacterium]